MSEPQTVCEQMFISRGASQTSDAMPTLDL